MYLTLHLPSLPLEALLRHHPEKRRFPCAVAATEKSHRSVPILALNRRAAACHLEPGFSITRALARCPPLLVLPRDPDAEAQALRDFLKLAESITPDFELTTPDTLTLDLSLHPRFQISNFKSPIEALGLPARLATGPTPDLTHLLALSPSTSDNLIFRGPHPRWSRGPHRSPPSQNVPPEAFQTLPIHLTRSLPHLELGTSHLELLKLWGLHTLADLALLPRQDLAERLGPEIAQLHDILHTKHHRPLHLIHPIESFVSIIHLEHSIDSSQALIFFLRKYLQNLLNRLNSRYLKAIHIGVSLRDENKCLKQLNIDLPEPSASLEILLAPLQSRLGSLQLSAPIETIELALTPSESSPGQHQLFGHSIRQPHRLSDTLIRLSALLGDDQIGFPVPHFTHRPDTFHLAPAHRVFQSRSPIFQPASPPPHEASSSSTAHCSLLTHHSAKGTPPLSRFRPPIEIVVAFDLPKSGHPHPLALLSGPHRGRILKHHGPFPLSGNWWSPPDSWQHLEWDIQLETHQLLRLSHTPPDLWHLQGHYC